jgi:hypothetical protein
LTASWGQKVCSAFQFPWGVSVVEAEPRKRLYEQATNCKSLCATLRPDSFHGVGQSGAPERNCCWRLSGVKEHWHHNRNWEGEVEGGRELRISWTNKNGTESYFVAFLEEICDESHVASSVLDITSLLISQAQHLSRDLGAFDSELSEAQLVQEAAKKSLQQLDEGESKDWKLVTSVGSELINRGKRAIQELEREQVLADAAAAYHSDDEKSDTSETSNSNTADDLLPREDASKRADGGAGGAGKEERKTVTVMSKRQRDRLKAKSET